MIWLIVVGLALLRAVECVIVGGIAVLMFWFFSSFLMEFLEGIIIITILGIVGAFILFLFHAWK